VREGAAAEREWADAVFATGGVLAGSVFAEALEAPQ
tara:strand:+ start:303 stop:410 length:108 start_codon:yes stop_codon:yes gene_type:complete